MEQINSSVRLGWRERIGFGAGDFAHNLVFHSTLTYLTYFYTDVAGISALFALVPALFGLVFVLLILFYPITTEYYQKILREIGTRGEEAGFGK